MNPKNTFFIILLLLAILTASFLLWGNEEGEILTRETPSVPVSSTTDAYETLTFPDNTLDTSDWQTYRSEEFGFEVKIPTTLNVKVRQAKEVNELEESLMGAVLFGDPHDPYSAFNILVYHEPVDVVSKRRIKATSIFPPEEGLEMRLNNLKVIYFGYSPSEQIALGTYFLGNSNYGYEITYTSDDDNTNMFEKILLSFKFIW